jgi:hypothetical protein
VRFFRRRPRLREIGESEAYGRSYGDRSADVKVIKLPPRRPRYRGVLMKGEQLRRAFVTRLDARAHEAEGEEETKTEELVKGGSE